MRLWNEHTIPYKIDTYKTAISEYHPNHPDVPKMKKIVKEYQKLLPKPKNKKKKESQADIDARIEQKMIKRYMQED